MNASLPGALYNDRDPQWFKKEETPLDRRIATMALEGFDIGEISAITGRSRQAVSNTLRQPHTRMYMTEQAEKPLQESLTEFLNAELIPSLAIMRDIRDGKVEGVKPSDRLAAAKELADRRLGRPTQPFAQQDKAPTEMTQAELDEQVKQLLEKNGRSGSSNTEGA
jgi:hypothetical protein